MLLLWQNARRRMVMGDPPLISVPGNEHREARWRRDRFPFLHPGEFIEASHHHGIVIQNEGPSLTKFVLVAAALERREICTYRLGAFRHYRTYSAKDHTIRPIALYHCIRV